MSNGLKKYIYYNIYKNISLTKSLATLTRRRHYGTIPPNIASNNRFKVKQKVFIKP